MTLAIVTAWLGGVCIGWCAHWAVATRRRRRRESGMIRHIGAILIEHHMAEEAMKVRPAPENYEPGNN